MDQLEEQKSVEGFNQRTQDEVYQEKLQQKLKQELEHTSKPMWITDKFVNKPFCVIVVCMISFLLSIILVGALKLFSFSESHGRDYLIWSHDRVKEFDANTQMQEEFQQNLTGGNVPLRSQTPQRWITNIILACDNCNLLTKRNLKIFVEFEKKIKQSKGYGDFCLSDPEDDGAVCSDDAFQTFTGLFPDIDNITDEDVENTIDFILQDDNFASFKLLFGDTFNANTRKSSLMRSVIKFGMPIQVDGKRYKDQFDDVIEQTNHFKEFTEKIIEISEDITEKYSGVEGLCFSRIVNNIFMKKTSDQDFLWAFASMMFVWFYIVFHLKSCFLGSVAMFNIIMSFPLSVVIFKLIFRITYFSTLHILAVFVVLGIAADDVFVFMDAWNQTAFYPQVSDDLNKRMAVTFRRAAKAMVATSSTTSAAFFATGLSTIMPISSFGFFAGILIPMNFLLVITFFPAVLVVQQKYFKQCCLFGKKKKEQLQNNNNNQDFTYADSESQGSPQRLVNSNSGGLGNNNQYQNCDVMTTDISPSPLRQTGQEDQQKMFQFKNDEVRISENQQAKQGSSSNVDLQKNRKEPWIEIFFATKFNDFVYKTRYVMLAGFLVWTCIAAWRAFQISPITEPEKFLPDDAMNEKALHYIRNEFHQAGNNDSGIKVNFTWGIKGINKDGVSRWDSEDLGKVIYDNSFSLAENQQYFYDLCQDLKTNPLVQDGHVSSFIDSFKDWLENVEGESFPVPEQDFISKLTQFSENAEYGLSHFNNNEIGLFNGKLKYVYIILAAEGVPFQPYKTLNPIYESWESLEQQINRNAPRGMNKMMQTGGFNWVWMISERAFVTNAVQGMVISIIFALTILVLSTLNFVMSLFSILSITGIVLSVVSIMEMQGWELGVAESITIVILIGLSVDFVVHLANHYVESVYPDKHNRIKISLKEIGVSIVSGAITTMGSGVFLFFATMIIFNKFAVLIICTMVFSLLYSLCFFSALLHTVGPQNDTGSVIALVNKLKEKLKQNKSDSNEDNTDNNQSKQKKMNKSKVMPLDESKKPSTLRGQIQRQETKKHTRLEYFRQQTKQTSMANSQRNKQQLGLDESNNNNKSKKENNNNNNNGLNTSGSRNSKASYTEQQLIQHKKSELNPINDVVPGNNDDGGFQKLGLQHTNSKFSQQKDEGSPKKMNNNFLDQEEQLPQNNENEIVLTDD